MIYKNMSRKDYEKKYGKIRKSSIGIDADITFYERETSILFNDEEDSALVTANQRPVIKHLLFDNPSFKLDKKGLIVKGKQIVGVNGSIDKNCVRFTKTPRERFDRL